ncbi:MAG: helix-hairpin-helix domain-containing protein [Alcaligenaceae bacterium]|nr:helix-hairpin-helix domain-containing protein [Alcaligenaceae bacterium]
MSALLKFLAVVMSCAYLSWVPLASAQTVNANTAGNSELQSIKGIGEKTAQRIIEERERGGSFESVEDFTLRIKGLGQKRAAKMVEGGLVFGNEQASHQLKSVQGTTTERSVVVGEIAAVKKRFKYSAPGGGSEPYLIKLD